MGIFEACLRGAPVSGEVDTRVLARSTTGFSGADIAEICQAASKNAVREAIAEAEAKGGEGAESKNSKMEIGKRHFNEAMSRARKSVSEKDLEVYEHFRKKQSIGKREGMEGDAEGGFKFDDDDVEEEGGMGGGGGKWRERGRERRRRVSKTTAMKMMQMMICTSDRMLNKTI